MYLPSVFTAIIIFLGLSFESGAQDLVEVAEVPVVTKDALEVAGILAWSMKLDFDAGTNSQLKVYAKRKAEAPILLVDGPLIRNDENKVKISRRVLVTVEGLLVQPHQGKLKVGIGAFDHASGTSTRVVANPMPKDLLYIVERFGLSKDSKGRIVLVKGHEESVTAVPMVNDHEYSIYLAIEPWSPKNKIKGEGE